MEHQTTLQVGQNREQLKKQIQALDLKYGGTKNISITNINAANTVNTNCTDYTYAIFYWFWKGYMAREKEIKNYTEEVKKLKRQKLITSSLERDLMLQIEIVENQLQRIVFDVLNNLKYKTFTGVQVAINTLSSLADVMLYLNNLVGFLKNKLESTIEEIKDSVQRRDILCSGEYKRDKKCDDEACEYYQPWFSGESKAVCRSKIR